jgi:hypothetical protein
MDPAMIEVVFDLFESDRIDQRTSSLPRLSGPNILLGFAGCCRKQDDLFCIEFKIGSWRFYGA